MVCFWNIIAGVYSYITGVFTCTLYKNRNMKGYSIPK